MQVETAPRAPPGRPLTRVSAMCPRRPLSWSRPPKGRVTYEYGVAQAWEQHVKAEYLFMIDQLEQHVKAEYLFMIDQLEQHVKAEYLFMIDQLPLATTMAKPK
jgi:hypothetical protein